MYFWESNEYAPIITRWLIEEKLKTDIPTAKQKLSRRHFKTNNLYGLYATYPLDKLIEMVEYDYATN